MLIQRPPGARSWVGRSLRCPVVGCAGLVWVLLLLSFPTTPEGNDECLGGDMSRGWVVWQASHP